MKINDISFLRITNQQIAESKFNSAKELVGYMGAIQAQDYPMSKWGIGLRVNDNNDKLVADALDKGEIIRTHVLRPTWHIVSSDDIYWMLELTANQIKTSMGFRDRELDLTPVVYKKSNKIIEKALADDNHLTRDELISILKQNKIAVHENRSSHLLMQAELEKIICSGRIKNGKQTYALLSERVPKKISLSREESLAKLAEKYFTSHGPADERDFNWWSGLPMKDVRKAIELVKEKFEKEKIDNSIYYFKNYTSIKKYNKVVLLPAYDEYIISYKDRTALLHPDNHKIVISLNGIFKPTILINGKISGIWKRTMKNDKVIISIDSFNNTPENIKSKIVKAAKSYAKFIGKTLEITM